ncbi:helix-turn-helix domain-containing protein [Serratia liquefaciens]|uniref:helix-turn-helix domain-containing protein n=1 Tax=Serratia liquefaciens TaxID=614 RepID=UPI00090020B5|nr:helix-turn-helix domain-containing protein [Serratia liquefaciens]HEJ7996368.1 helix-turn-helix domain-containing protein [Serratia liquefaciens]
MEAAYLSSHSYTPPEFYKPTDIQRKELSGILNDVGQILTVQRISILHYLASLPFPTGVDLIAKKTDVPLSTTYRVLQILAECGLADFIVDKASIQRWFLIHDGSNNACSSCGQVYHTGY